MAQGRVPLHLYLAERERARRLGEFLGQHILGVESHGAHRRGRSLAELDVGNVLQANGQLAGRLRGGRGQFGNRNSLLELDRGEVGQRDGGGWALGLRRRCGGRLGLGGE